MTDETRRSPSQLSPPADGSLIRIDRLSKSYQGVHALRDVDLEIRHGEVHALCGENGAGKSTLIKILTGVVRPDSGEVLVSGRLLAPGHVHESENAGIAVMHQESTAFPHLDAVDNIFVGRELTRLGGWWLDRASMERRTYDLLERLGEDFTIDIPIGDLSLAQRQMVALARALSRECRLLIMDEPTASLSMRETSNLLSIVRQLRADGISVLYVSHRLDEVFSIADRVTVLRDGQRVATQGVKELNTEKLIAQMVGRDLGARTVVPRPERAHGSALLEVSQLTRAGAFQGITFSVSAGEIVGLAGLVGAGRSEVARAVFGIDPYDSGRVTVDGQPLPPNSVPAAISAHLALVPEDRQHEGLILPMSVGQNISLAVLRTLGRRGTIDRQREATLVNRQLRDLLIKASSPEDAAETLSGGNQQKLVIGKWLASQPRVLILDEPTRGIDVGAKVQVHRLIGELANQGVAILVISSELPELLSISDRILVLREGNLTGELIAASASQEKILQLALPDVPKVATA